MLGKKEKKTQNRQSASVAQPMYYSEFSLQTCAAQARVNKHTTGKHVYSKTFFIMKKVIASVT